MLAPLSNPQTVFGRSLTNRLRYQERPPAELHGITGPPGLQPVLELRVVQVVVARVANDHRRRILRKKAWDVPSMRHLRMSREDVVDHSARQNSIQLAFEMVPVLGMTGVYQDSLVVSDNKVSGHMAMVGIALEHHLQATTQPCDTVGDCARKGKLTSGCPHQTPTSLTRSMIACMWLCATSDPSSTHPWAGAIRCISRPC